MAFQNGLTDEEQYEMDLGQDLYQKVKPYFKPATDVKVVEKLGRGRFAKIKKSFFNGKVLALKYSIGKYKPWEHWWPSKRSIILCFGRILFR